MSAPLQILGGRYEVGDLIGRGGMAEVHKGHDTRLGRPVAIKLLRADKVADQDRRRRFIQEARSASALNHPNIVTIYEIGEAGGYDFIAMEFVEGQSLSPAQVAGPTATETGYRLYTCVFGRPCR